MAVRKGTNQKNRINNRTMRVILLHLGPGTSGPERQTTPVKNLGLLLGDFCSSK